MVASAISKMAASDDGTKHLHDQHSALIDLATFDVDTRTPATDARSPARISAQQSSPAISPAHQSSPSITPAHQSSPVSTSALTPPSEGHAVRTVPASPQPPAPGRASATASSIPVHSADAAPTQKIAVPTLQAGSGYADVVPLSARVDNVESKAETVPIRSARPQSSSVPTHSSPLAASKPPPAGSVAISAAGSSASQSVVSVTAHAPPVVVPDITTSADPIVAEPDEETAVWSVATFAGVSEQGTNANTAHSKGCMYKFGMLMRIQLSCCDSTWASVAASLGPARRSASLLSVVLVRWMKRPPPRPIIHDDTSLSCFYVSSCGLFLALHCYEMCTEYKQCAFMDTIGFCVVQDMVMITLTSPIKMRY